MTEFQQCIQIQIRERAYRVDKISVCQRYTDTRRILNNVGG